MALSDADILLNLAGRGLVITEPYPEIIQPASVDLHLGRDLKKLVSTLIDPLRGGEVRYEDFTMDGGWVLQPGSFILGATQEWVEIPNDLIGIITGKSSLARIGLQVEAAGFADPKWKGRLTLELYNMGTAMIVLRPGMPICQLRFFRLISPIYHGYGDPELGSHYQGSDGVVGARFSVLKPE